MRMTQPSSTADSATVLGDDPPVAYQSMTNFGAGKAKTSMLNKKPSKGSLSAKRPLPAMDHAKIMDKLASITGGLSSGDESNVQFSKPKIGVRRDTNSVAKSMKGKLSSNADFANKEQSEGSHSALNKQESLVKLRRRVASQGIR